MLCQNCNQNEANVKYTQIINGIKKQMNLCDKCAKELGINNISFDMKMDFSNFLGDIFDDFENECIPNLAETNNLLCDKCGSRYDDFIKNGKFGCDKCYITFEDKIDNILKNIHGVNNHIGKKLKIKEEKQDNNYDIQNKEKKKKDIKMFKIQKLREKLKQEIKEERYEDAAKTRDEIKKLEE